jgi:hypothetical protein
MEESFVIDAISIEQKICLIVGIVKYVSGGSTTIAVFLANALQAIRNLHSMRF